jgi:hypothetical protein
MESTRQAYSYVNTCKSESLHNVYIKIKHFWKKENLGEKRKKSFFLFPVLRWGWGGGEGEGGHIFKMADMVDQQLSGDSLQDITKYGSYMGL